MIAALLSCGLRRAEVAGLTVEDLQQLEEHWVTADLVGKGGHVRTVLVPTWVKVAVDGWLTAAGISTGPIFRAINKAQRIGTSSGSEMRLTTKSDLSQRRLEHFRSRWPTFRYLSRTGHRTMKLFGYRRFQHE